MKIEFAINENLELDVYCNSSNIGKIRKNSEYFWFYPKNWYYGFILSKDLHESKKQAESLLITIKNFSIPLHVTPAVETRIKNKNTFITILKDFFS